MFKIFKLMKLAKQYKVLWKEWHKQLRNGYLFDRLQDKEHEILGLIIE